MKFFSILLVLYKHQRNYQIMKKQHIQLKLNVSYSEKTFFSICLFLYCNSEVVIIQFLLSTFIFIFTVFCVCDNMYDYEEKHFLNFNHRREMFDNKLQIHSYLFPFDFCFMFVPIPFVFVFFSY